MTYYGRGPRLITGVGLVARAALVLGVVTGLLAGILPGTDGFRSSLWGSFLLSLMISYILSIYFERNSVFYGMIMLLLPVFSLIIYIIIRYFILFIKIQTSIISGYTVSYGSIMNIDTIGIIMLMYCLGNLPFIDIHLIGSIFYRG
jgi:hypothetical protein